MSCECLGSSPNESSLLIFIVLFFTRLFKCRHRCGGAPLSREAYFKNATTMIYCVNMSEYDNNELNHGDGCKVNFTLLTAIF
jgi:hypothetical protein